MSVRMCVHFCVYIYIHIHTHTHTHTHIYIHTHTHTHINFALGGCPHGVMVTAMDCGIVVSEFVLQSRYYVHFWENTLRKGMNPLILPAMG